MPIMKKLLLLCFIAFAGFACEGPVGPPGPPGAGTTFFIQDFQVRSADWQLVNNPDNDVPNQFRFIFDNVRDLTPYVYQNGNVNVYLYQDKGLPTEVLRPMECTIYKEFNSLRWSETYSFDMQPNSIAFYVKTSDFALDPPPTCWFKVIMTY